jgi:shikimate dehydrogenase
MKIVDGATRLYAIIGDPIEQVKSPEALTDRFRAAQRNALLVPVHVPTAELDAVVPALKRIGNLDGIVVTVPFKVRMLAHCDKLLDTGRQVGAINALRREKDASWTGDMFDGRGLVRGLRERGIPIEGRRVLLLGAGGAGSAAGFALAAAGAAAITVHEVDRAKAERLAAGIRSAYPACMAAVGDPDPAGYDILANATPVGMNEDARMPAPLGPLDPKLVVFDVVTKPEVTPLLRHASACGCKVYGGRLMYEGQLDELVRFFGMEGR